MPTPNPLLKNKLTSIFNNLLNGINRDVTSLTKSIYLHSIGEDQIQTFNPEGIVQIPYLNNIGIESYTISELVQFNNSFELLLIGMHQNLIIQNWQNALNELFRVLAEGHLQNIIKLKKIKGFRIQYDFSSTMDITSQILEGLCDEFDFLPYPQKVSYLNKTFNLVSIDTAALNDSLGSILKHVQIRNCLQHSQGIITPNILKFINQESIPILNNDGTTKELKVGEYCSLSMAEIHRLKESLYFIIALWKTAQLN